MDVGAYFPHRVTYHPTCHSLRVLRVGDRPLRLLRAVRGIDLVELPDAEECCGFGGTFAVKNADTSSGAMLADKIAAVRATGAAVCAAGDASCLMHIGGGLSRLGAGRRDHASRRDPGEHPVTGASASAGTAAGCGQLRAPGAVSRGRPNDALADAQLRRNLRHATSTIRDQAGACRGRTAATGQQLRAAGAAIKDDVLAHLDRYLMQLEQQVAARGGTVHWARDADEANRIVTGLVAAAGAAEVVKVKSMATQEIGLNEALAGAGISVVETDLAELIVQLGHDTPSHILVPAIHRNRAEIRDIFLREMPDVDPDLTDDPAALAEAARRHLRRKFLRGRGGDLRRELRRRRDRHAGRGGVRGQRPHVPDPAAPS